MSIIESWESRRRIVNHVKWFLVIILISSLFYTTYQLWAKIKLLDEKEVELVKQKERYMDLVEIGGELYSLCEHRFKYAVQGNLQEAYESLDKEESLYKIFQGEVRK